jgi:RND family efflux transporter MFP subunit
MFRFVSIALVAVAAVFFFVGYRERQDSPETAQAQAQPAARKAVAVKTRTVEESGTLQRRLEYPAVVSNRQETTLVASAAGTASQVLFNVGDRVGVGQLLVRVDDPANGIAPENGFKSAAVRQAQIAVDQAKESYAQAKRTYDKDKSKANKSARDLAKLDYESAQIALQNIYDARLIKSPVSGIVTTKNVSSGSTVSDGQILATISPSKDVVAKFSVNQNEIGLLALGAPVVLSYGRQSFDGKISSISPQADGATGKFLVEARPNDQKASSLLAGTVATASIAVTAKPHQSGAIILPLSAVTTGQNESFVFIENGGAARKTVVSVLHIDGENAEVAADLPFGSRIIVEGNKLVQDGDPVITE